MGTVIAVLAVRPAMPAEPLAMSRIPVVHIVAVPAERSRAPAAQQTQRGDDRVERIRVLGIVKHAPILHAT
jgi:hypothetical protein